MRRPRARRFRDLIGVYTNDLGTTASNAQRHLIRDLAMMQMLCEDLQLRFIEDDEPLTEDVNQYSRLSTGIKSTMRKLGLTVVRDDDDDEYHDADLDRPVRLRL